MIIKRPLNRKLRLHTLQDIDITKIVYLCTANSGAMGDPESITLIMYDCGRVTIYYINSYTRLGAKLWNVIVKDVVPKLKKFDFTTITHSKAFKYKYEYGNISYLNTDYTYDTVLDNQAAIVVDGVRHSLDLDIYFVI